MGKSTLNALLARGIDSNLAKSVTSKKLTIKDLKKKKINELISLGFSEFQAKEIDKESRPPIPTKTVIKLLHESKFCCCICRDRNRSVIIHHIEEWNISKSHEEDNLVVLCLLHHDTAHTKKDLSLNLSKTKLIELKEKWIEEAKLQDTYAILGLMKPSGARYDYFNHKRIFELTIKSKIPFNTFSTYNKIKDKYLDEFGYLRSYEEWLVNYETKIHMYNFWEGLYIGSYMTDLFNYFLSTIPIIDLTPIMNKATIESVLKKGDIIAIQAGFYVKSQSKVDRGINQIRKLHYHKRNVTIEFLIDAFECTSTSAWGDHISGHKSLTPIGVVNSILREGGELKIGLSCLAIGAWFDEHEFKKAMNDNIRYLSYTEEPDDEN